MDSYKPFRRFPKRVLLPATSIFFVVAAVGLTSLGFGSSFLGLSDRITASKASAQPLNGLNDDEADVYTIADFVNRSPGERGEVNALKGVVRSVVASVGNKAGPSAPAQRALGKIFDAEPLGEAGAPADSLAALPLAGADAAPSAPQPMSMALGPINNGGGPIFAAAPGGVFNQPPVVPPSEGGGGGVDGPAPPPPVTPIPEPDTWAMIIIGLFGIGLAMRRANVGRSDRLIKSAL